MTLDELFKGASKRMVNANLVMSAVVRAVSELYEENEICPSLEEFELPEDLYLYYQVQEVAWGIVHKGIVLAGTQGETGQKQFILEYIDAAIETPDYPYEFIQEDISAELRKVKFWIERELEEC